MNLNNGFSTNLLSLQGLRILVVDNNIDSCNWMTVMLQSYGAKVQVAFLVQPALKIFVEWQPNVLVSEIALPQEDGCDPIRQVKKLRGEQGREALAIAVTAYISEDTKKCALSAGFDLWFTKPLNVDDFVAVLGCLAICQRSSYAIAQRILGGVPKYSALSHELSHEKQLEHHF